MVDGGDGNGESLAEGRESGCDATMAEGSGCDATMAEGDGFCIPEGQYEPPVAMGNISSQDGSFSTYQGQSQHSSDMGNHSIQGVHTPQGQSRPPFAMSRSNYVEGVHTPQGQSRPPFAMGHSNYVEGHGRAIYISQPQSQSRPESQCTSVHHVLYPTYDGNNTPHSMPLVYPTPTSFQKLLRDTTAVQLSQASHSPADSHVDGHPWKACTER